MPTRRNPPAGAVVFDSVTTRSLRAGFVGDVPDDNAEHVLHGLTTITGAADTVVLTVEQHTRLQDMLRVRSLEVGLTADADPTQDDPYAASPYDDSPYADEGATAAQTGLTIDEGGNVRMTGLIVAKHAPGALILRAPTGVYYQFGIDTEGALGTTGTLLGPTPP